MRNILIFPFLFFMAIFFIYPIGTILSNSVYDASVVNYLPNTTRALLRNTEINEDVFSSLAMDLKNSESGRAVTYINYYYVGFKTLVRKTKNKLSPPYNISFVNIDKRWKDPKLWNIIRQHTTSFNVASYKKIFDIRNLDASVYLKILINTLVISFFITIVTCMVSYPMAFYLLKIQDNKILFNILMMFVLLPFFTSYLSRLVSWLVLLQNEGIINNILIYFGIPTIELMYNTTGIFIGSVYVLLPLAVLPIYAVLRMIPKNYSVVSNINGASSFQTFRYVYFPLSLPGLYNAGLLVYMTAIGFFTTPSFMGGSSGQFITEQIVRHIEITLNWPLASALSVSLLTIVLVLFIVYVRLNKGNHGNIK